MAAIDIRLPNINGTTEKEQLTQIKSYLFQLAEQLQWALKNADTSSNNVVVTPVAKSLVSSVPTASSPEATFSSIKALIIKSADIISAYYDEINKRLVGRYEALSDFGAFREVVTQDITQSATRIDNAFTNMQSIESYTQELSTSVEEVKSGVDTNVKALTDDINQLDTELSEAKSNLSTEIADIEGEITTLNFALAEVNANIRQGLLYVDDNGLPVYGLEIGQTNTIDGEKVFDKFARFTSDRLSFYDQNGSEVAYISDFKLYIINAEVTGTLKLGGYLVDTTNGLTFKWVGRG